MRKSCRMPLLAFTVVLAALGACKTGAGNSSVKDEESADAGADSALTDVLGRIDADLDVLGVPPAPEALGLADAPAQAPPADLPAEINALVQKLTQAVDRGQGGNPSEMRALIVNLQALVQLSGPELTAEQRARVAAVITRAQGVLNPAPPPKPTTPAPPPPTPVEPPPPPTPVEPPPSGPSAHDRCVADCEPPFDSCMARAEDDLDRNGCDLDRTLCRTNCIQVH
jgi:hypothetical protein